MHVYFNFGTSSILFMQISYMYICMIHYICQFYVYIIIIIIILLLLECPCIQQRFTEWDDVGNVDNIDVCIQ